jgi:crotonobetaine/carnitine-CoA ligase
MPRAAEPSTAQGFPATDDGFLPRFARQAAATPHRVFARIGERALTFGALERSSAAQAAWLRARSVAAGDRVALMLRNGEAALSLMLAIARAGAVWVPVNTQAVGDNLAYVLSHAEPRIVVAEPDLLPTISACGADLRCPTISAADALDEAQAVAPIGDIPVYPPADTAFAIMYTSGTSGRPKGVIVSHRMLRLAGEAAALVSAARDGDVLYVWEPLFHIGGAQMIVLPLIRNVTLVIAGRFSASRFWADLGACGATHMHFLGGILQMLLEQPPGPLDRTHGVRIAWGGGCPRDVWRPFEARFGVEIRECYGMTECSSFTTANLDGTVGSVGKPIPWLDVAVADAAGKPVAVGERGEIMVRERLPGALTRGYFKDPIATEKAFRDGAFRTGDIASRDAAGNLYFHGRMTDSVRVRGENVTAAEVEDVARKHPAIEDCAMIGVAAAVGEAEIKLLVKPKAGASLSPAALSAWLAQRLARYQRPRYIAVVDEFERTPSQRIMKHKLSRRTDDAWDAAVEAKRDGQLDPSKAQGE